MTSYSKDSLLGFFREFADREMASINEGSGNFKSKSLQINKKISHLKNLTLEELIYNSEKNHSNPSETLNKALMITYVSYIVLLEYRNTIWPYDYMSFSRRIGELWEPFCKSTFYYSIRPLLLVDPPDFLTIQNDINERFQSYIWGLNISPQQKQNLFDFYNIPWNFVDSGNIQMGLDLHFRQNGIRYNCDFKSGFSSNEKGNTNRLLLVASIYNYISDNEKTIMFVRQREDENNHYLQTLSSSGTWDVFCGNDAYQKMSEFTGFDLRKWIDQNINWVEDISDDLYQHLYSNDLIKYLTW